MLHFINIHNWNIIKKEIEVNRVTCLLIVDNERNGRVQQWKTEFTQFLQTLKIPVYVMPFNDPKWKPGKEQIPYVYIINKGQTAHEVMEEQFCTLSELIQFIQQNLN